MEALSSLLNYTGLLFVCVGDDKYAEELCNRQIDWLYSLASEYKVSKVAALAIQPWVNLGRLYRLRREVDRAVEQFRAIYCTSSLGKVRFGKFSLDHDTVWGEHIETLYVFDTAKAYIYSGRFDEALSFCDQTRTKLGTKGAIAILSELRLRVLDLMGEVAAATAVLKLADWNIEYHSILVNAFYRATLSNLMSGGVVTGEEVLKKISSYLRNCLTGVDIDHRCLRFTLSVAHYLHRIGFMASGDEMISLGYLASTVCEDVPMQVEFAKLVTSGSPLLGVNIKPFRELVKSSGHVMLASRYEVELPAEAAIQASLCMLKAKLNKVV